MQRPPMAGARQHPQTKEWFIQHPTTGQHYRIGMKGEEKPPIEGARKAPDGKWYVKHPSGVFMRAEAA
jgi:hypothetical protein